MLANLENLDTGIYTTNIIRDIGKNAIGRQIAFQMICTMLYYVNPGKIFGGVGTPHL